MNTIETDTYIVSRKGSIMELELEKTDYIFRKVLVNNVNGEVKSKSVQTRLRKLLTSIGLNKQVSIKSIFDSGLIAYTKQLAEENNISLTECLNDSRLWEKVLIRYGYKKENESNIPQLVLFRIKYEIQQYINE